MTVPAWVRNGSGWLKVGLVVLGLVIGYAMRLERDSQRISVIEKWIVGQTAITTALRERIRFSEANVSALTAGQAATASNIANMYLDLREIRSLLASHASQHKERP